MSIVCRGVEFCGRRERVVNRENNEHSITSLSKALWQAGTKGKSSRTRQSNRQPAGGATEVASRLVKRRIVPHASRLLNWYRGRIDGGQVVELEEQISGKVPGLARRKCQERRRPGDCKAKWWEENLIADTDEVHADRSIKCRKKGSNALEWRTRRSQAWQRRIEMRESQCRVQRQR